MPIKKFHSRVFNKLNNDELILKFLQNVGKAVPPVAIVLGTGLSPAKVSQRLRKLEKYKLVRKMYRKIPLYSLRVDKNGK